MNSLETAKHYFALSNIRDLDTISTLLDTDAIYNSENTGLFFGNGDIMIMMRNFFEKYPLLHWDVLSEREVSKNIIEIHFELTMTDLHGNTTKKSGKEIIISKENRIHYIEVKNIINA